MLGSVSHMGNKINQRRHSLMGTTVSPSNTIVPCSKGHHIGDCTMLHAAVLL
jgi:hypothetical protein